MCKLRNELIRFINSTGISPRAENSNFTSLPDLNFGDEYVALTLQDYVLKHLGESFWISGTDDEDFYQLIHFLFSLVFVSLKFLLLRDFQKKIENRDSQSAED